MSAETEALTRYFDTIENGIRALIEKVNKINGHILDHQIAITAIERRVEHIEKYINTLINDPNDMLVYHLDPMAEMLKPTSPCKGGTPDG